MKIQTVFVRWCVLFGCFLPSSSSAQEGDYEGFPIEDPLVTGTFMEYRPTTGSGRERVAHHFHGGIDFRSDVSNNIVRPVAGGELYYLERSGNTYSFWIDHPSNENIPEAYRGLSTRYVHLRDYPGAELHEEGEGRPVTTSDVIGTIDGDHLHFEVRDGTNRRNAHFFNPLSTLPRIEDAAVDYALAYRDDPWTFFILDDNYNGRGESIDVVGPDTPASIPFDTTFRLLFEGFDRINTNTNRLGFYSITARFMRREEEDIWPTTLLEWTFTADWFPRALYNSPQYLFNVSQPKIQRRRLRKMSLR